MCISFGYNVYSIRGLSMNMMNFANDLFLLLFFSILFFEFFLLTCPFVCAHSNGIVFACMAYGHVCVCMCVCEYSWHIKIEFGPVISFFISLALYITCLYVGLCECCRLDLIVCISIFIWVQTCVSRNLCMCVRVCVYWHWLYDRVISSPICVSGCIMCVYI